MKIEVVRLHKLDGSGATKAFVDLAIDDALVIRGVQVVEGKDGLFISMPREEGKDGKWYSTVIPLTRDTKAEIERLVLDCYDYDKEPTEIRIADKKFIVIPTEQIGKEIADGRRDTTQANL